MCVRAGAVGVYVPGGTAILPSSALMLSVPAGRLCLALVDCCIVCSYSPECRHCSYLQRYLINT